METNDGTIVQVGNCERKIRFLTMDSQNI